MTDYARIVDGTAEKTGLREELTLITIDVAPERYPEHEFEAAEYDDGIPIESQKGRARVFEVVSERGFTQTVLGYQTHEPSQIWSIKIWYPAGQAWEAAATSDYQAIRQAVIEDTSYPSGVMMRVVLDLEASHFEDTEDPSGFFMSVPILVVLSVT